MSTGIFMVCGRMFQRQYGVFSGSKCHYCDLQAYMRHTKGFKTIDENGLFSGCFAKSKMKCAAKIYRNAVIVKTWLPLTADELKAQKKACKELESND